MIKNTFADLSMLVSAQEEGDVLIKDLAQIDAENVRREYLSLIHISEPTRPY